MSVATIIAIIVVILIVAIVIIIPVLCSRGVIPNCPGFTSKNPATSSTTGSTTGSTAGSTTGPTTGSTAGSTVGSTTSSTITQPPAPASTPSSASTAAPITYIKCADEGGNCTNTLPLQLYAYTSGDPNMSNAPANFKVMPAGNVACNNSTFGDPEFGKGKKCFNRVIPDNILSILNTKSVDVSKDTNWYLCAGENEICNIPANITNVDILYGANGIYTYTNVSKPFTCSYKVLGTDPVPGVPKGCFYSNPNAVQVQSVKLM